MVGQEFKSQKKIAISEALISYYEIVCKKFNQKKKVEKNKVVKESYVLSQTIQDVPKNELNPQVDERHEAIEVSNTQQADDDDFELTDIIYPINKKTKS